MNIDSLIERGLRHPVWAALAVLAVIAGVAAMVTVGGSSDAPPTASDAPPAASTTAPTTRPDAPPIGTLTPPAASTDAPTPGDDDATHDPTRAARVAAIRFTRAWLSGRGIGHTLTREAWLDAMRPYALPALVAGLTITDPADLPAAAVAPHQPDVPQFGESTAIVVVHLTTGRDVRVGMVHDDGGTAPTWKASDIEPVGPLG